MSDSFADEPIDDSENDDEENFAELLESYSSGLDEDLRVGDKVTVNIISIGRETVFVDTGSKIDGTVDKGELLDDKGEMPYQEGDSLTLYVVAVKEGELHLSKAVSGIGGLHMLQEAYDGEIPVEGRVAETCKGGFRVEMLQRKAFCPISQMDLKYVETPEDYVGQTHAFLIMQLAENGKNIVVSRRKLLSQEQEKVQKEFLEGVRNGDVLTGTVSRLMPFGAFVEVAPGLEGMVHISELGWSRVETAGEVVAVGDVVSARLIGLEKQDKGRVKLSLSIKQVQEDPWNSVAQTFNIGDKIKGKVTRCMDFGAFVEIAPGIEGLVHISEMSYVKRVLNSEDVVAPGESIPVVIKDLDPAGRRISLSMRDAEGDPWLDVAEKYTPGQRVEGIVEKHESFGIFISLEPGITGLLHKSRISRAEKPSTIERLKVGETLPVIVEKIQAGERKITLKAGDAKEEGDWKKYAKGGGQSMGSLGEQLQRALAKKQDR